MSFPRRMSLSSMTPSELAIYNAIQEIEKIGADVRLTDAVNMLSKAKDLVSDFIDGVKPNPTDVNGDEVKGNDFAIREDIANILRDNIAFAPQVGDYVIHGAIEKIIQYFSKLEPKAAAPKAVKSKEEIIAEVLHKQKIVKYQSYFRKAMSEAMEEYANQFKSPQAK